ncbi:HD family phosphohydrolase [Alicyclobacillus tolerans]|uniref:Nucleotidyltransferase with HDIG domain n=1 Tax=Alicyclobacillus tolerans TaxID=90970 RepID=A0ABT9LSZ6_9BACL|nr:MULTISPECIES: HDIG domain-containing metalloprotein [Alicyclobacillus]MDP9727382.1 putative nucleotidyltransferase with HDIG domain [Alicyclobacillus tengchongensis]QRF23119.1 HDIG domain-containing protein [Alicyclobacillus sp. TC]
MTTSKWYMVLRRILDNPDFRASKRIRLAIYMLMVILVYAILLSSVLPPKYHLAVGQVSPVTIRSPITTVNTQATEEARQEAMAHVPKQYVQSPAVLEQALQQIDELYNAAISESTDKSLSQAQRIESLQSIAPKGVSMATLQALSTLSSQDVGILQSVSERIVKELLGVPFYSDSLQQASLLVDRQMLNYDLNRVSRLIVQNVVSSVLKPNMIYQKQATEAAREAAAKSVANIMIHQGDVIVAKNGIVTNSVQSELMDVGLYSGHPNYGIVFGFALYVILSVGLLAAYVERRDPRRRLDNLMLLVLLIVFVLVSILIALTKSVVDSGPSAAPFLMPISLGAMLVSVMMDGSLAGVTSFYFSFLVAAAFGFQFEYVLYSFIGSLVGAYSVGRVTSRSTFMRAGFLVSGVNVISVLATHFMQMDNGASFHDLSVHLGLALLNGVLSAVLVMGILPFFETTFGLLTAIRLLELSNPNHPLLRKVLLEAPGTYHHSLIVGNLAEAAAELVGADPLICRVGAYYHDVGKTRRPMFFVENQMTKENPHEKIAPSLSHLIITSHVTDGLVMLQRAGLPKPIQDICATHHGTTILWYFYNKAKEMDKNGTVRVDDFRYPGPKPKTRECAIVMICDAIEAAVRSMARPTPNRVEGVIRKIIKDRLQDGQLDECDLTLQDLDVMVSAFMKTLKGIYHSRIEYPDIDKLRKEVGK